ncbi:MAG: M20 family metallopeptidase [Ignavibacterium sp.]
MLSPIELRHRLHQIPELMFKEFETTKLLFENISRLQKIKIHKPLETGLIIEYTVNSSDYLLFRADIDALPIEEKTNIEFASKNGNMHACGHDVHSSILYGFLKYVTENNIEQNILFLFQPAEEGGGGAEKILKSNILNDFKIKSAFALHVTDEFDFGTIASTNGVLFSSALEINIEFIGKESHIAFPENGENALTALRLFLDTIEKIPKNLNEPFVFGVGKVKAGIVRNVIPAQAYLEASLRVLRKEKAEEFKTQLNNILISIQNILNVKYNITYGSFYSEVLVNKKLFETYSKVLSNKFNFIDCGYRFTGEDFGFISQVYPSFMFWLGTYKNKRYGLHNSKFLPDDSIIEIGINAFLEILLYELNNKNK